MSFFNSLRRTSVPAEQSENEPLEKTPVPTRLRAFTIWSLSRKKRQSVPWDLQMSKSDDSSETKTIENDMYQKYDPDNPDHIEAKNAREDQATESKPRGRSMSWSKSSPFSSLRRQSPSCTRSPSPARNILHRAAELVRAPAAFFYKERPSEGSTKPLVQDPSPSKSLRSKKSVHFLPSDDEDEVAPKTSPIPIPGKSAPLLPPVRISTSALMNVGDGSTAAVTGHFPPNLMIDPCAMQTEVRVPDHHLLDLSVLHEGCSVKHGAAKIRAHCGLEDPFSDKAEVESSEIQPTSTLNVSHKAEQLSAVSGLGVGKGLQVLSDHASVSVGDIRSDPDFYHELQNPFNSPIDSRVTTAKNTPSSLDNSRADTQELNKASTSAKDARTLSNVSLPLRFKSPTDLMGHDNGGLNDQMFKAGHLLPEQAVSDNFALDHTATPANDSKLDINALRASLRQSSPASDSDVQKLPSTEDIHDCVNMLQNMSIEDKPSKDDFAAIEKLQSLSTPHERPRTSTRLSPCRNESGSPNRRRFRFENRADTSSGEHLVVPPNTPFSRQVSQSPEARSQDTATLQTPSPSEVPLPPSIHPTRQNTMLCQAHTFRDQRGWSPFADGRFAEAAVEMILKENGDKAFIELICQNGGFSRFWNDAGLSPKTAPQGDTIAPSQKEAGNLTDAVIGWAHHRYSKEPGKSSPSPKYDTLFPVKYFKRRDGPVANDGFFAPVTSFDSNRSSEAFSEATHNLMLNSSGDSTATDLRSSSGRSVESVCQEITCCCNPCRCNPCYCGFSEKEVEEKQYILPANTTTGCTCNPCQCDPCLCGTDKTCEESAHGEHPNKSVMLAPTTETSAIASRTSGRAFSASSEPSQEIARRLPQIGSVPLRYFNGGSISSRTTLASDTTVDEEEAYCAGII